MEVSSRQGSRSEDAYSEEEDPTENNDAEAANRYFPDYKPIKNTNKRFTIIAEANAKEALKELNTKRELEAQRMSRLYCAGSDSTLINGDVQRRERREITLNLDKFRSAIASEEPTISVRDSRSIKPAERVLQMTDSLRHSTRDKHVPEMPHQSQTLYNPHSHGDWKESLFTRAQTDNHSHLRTHTALYLLDRCDTGPYSAPLSVSPYDPKLLVPPSLPSTSIHSLPSSLYPGRAPAKCLHNDDAHRVADCRKEGGQRALCQRPCCWPEPLQQSEVTNTRSLAYQLSSLPSLLLGSLSALQASLVACGQLVSTELQEQGRVQTKVQQSLLQDGVRHSQQHAKWLLTLGPKSKVTPSASRSKTRLGASPSSTSRIPPPRQGASHLREKDPRPVKGSMLEHDLEGTSRSLLGTFLEEEGEDGDSYSLRSQKRSTVRPQRQQQSSLSYEGALATHLHTETKDTTGNPFRLQERDSKIRLSASRSLSTLRSRQVDPKSYSSDSLTAHYGGFAVAVKEPYVSGVPSLDKVNKALVQLSRRMIVCYDTKVVETGAALKVSSSPSPS
jgi:hypothetical protein